MDLKKTISDLGSVDIFEQRNIKDDFVGRPFNLDYDKAFLLVGDSCKAKIGGIPQGTLLLAFYDNEEAVSETLLLRALQPAKLPTANDVISSMIEYYKDNLKTTGKESQLDDYTRYEFSFSGLECRVLGTFYKDVDKNIIFGADVENFYSAHHYSVYKPNGKILEFVVNLKDNTDAALSKLDIKIGKVRYSSSQRFQESIDVVPVYISPKDFLGKRTALFGMTRTGKSNSVKKIIEATVGISTHAKTSLGKIEKETDDNLQVFDNNGDLKYPVGQIIFDINGEYANANMQDEGTAIFELFKESVIRYSVIPKSNFKVMKVNFYNDIISGFELIKSAMENVPGDYVKSFLAIDWQEPEKSDHAAICRYGRKLAAYKCCLSKAGFVVPDNQKIIKFQGNADLNKLVQEDGKIDPSRGISIDDAVNWFTAIWDNYNVDYFTKYKRAKGNEWADEDLQALLKVLTRKSKAGGSANISGFIKLRGLAELHTSTVGEPFEIEMTNALRLGKIIIIDLSQGNPEIQQVYSERICRKIFSDAMQRFIGNIPNNYIQFYFEEAHNLFPKKDDKDLSQIYNRLAKEGAKLNLGLIYATQEVSSISANILKNTQNWFISHLNNDDELKELRKYYDFKDFTDSLIKFSSNSDKGFVRMKTYSNPFVVPVQIDRFLSDKKK